MKNQSVQCGCLDCVPYRQFNCCLKGAPKVGVSGLTNMPLGDHKYKESMNVNATLRGTITRRRKLEPRQTYRTSTSILASTGGRATKVKPRFKHDIDTQRTLCVLSSSHRIRVSLCTQAALISMCDVNGYRTDSLQKNHPLLI